LTTHPLPGYGIVMALRLLAPSSAGDVLDRLTILAIKSARVEGARAENVGRELGELNAVWRDAGLGEWRLAPEHEGLAATNARLWDVEDQLRGLEAVGEFGPTFVALARRVYQLNDQRARLKRAVNERVGSWIVEEKVHPGYGAHA
jgi:hypothetical protein